MNVPSNDVVRRPMRSPNIQKQADPDASENKRLPRVCWFDQAYLAATAQAAMPKARNQTSHAGESFMVPTYTRPSHIARALSGVNYITEWQNPSSCFVDFSIPPWYLKTARNIASVRQVPLHFAVLRPSELVCAERAAARVAGRVSDYARFRELYRRFDEMPGRIVANDSAAPNDAAKLIAEGLNAGRFEIA